MFSVPPPPDGRGLVRVKFSVASYCAFPEVPNPILWVKIGGRVMDRQEITGPMDFEYQVQVEDSIIGKKGLSIGFTPRVEIAYGVKGFRERGQVEAQGLAGWRRTVPAGLGQKETQGPRSSSPGLSSPSSKSSWIPITWPLGRQPNGRSTMGELGDNAKSAEKLLALWMERACRRPVKATERKPFLAFYQKLRGDGMTFDNALRSTFQSVLMSSPFRYLDSTAHEDKVIADHAVASR